MGKPAVAVRSGGLGSVKERGGVFRTVKGGGWGAGTRRAVLTPVIRRTCHFPRRWFHRVGRGVRTPVGRAVGLGGAWVGRRVGPAREVCQRRECCHWRGVRSPRKRVRRCAYHRTGEGMGSQCRVLWSPDWVSGPDTPRQDGARRRSRAPGSARRSGERPNPSRSYHRPSHVRGGAVVVPRVVRVVRGGDASHW